MKGLRLVAIYVGIAWILVGTGVLWTGFAAFSDASSARTEAEASAAEALNTFDADQKKREAELTEAIAEAQQGVEEAEEDLDGVSDDDKRAKRSADAKLAKAKEALDRATTAKEDLVAELAKKREALVAKGEAKIEALAGPGGVGFPWKAIIAVVLGIGFFALGFMRKSSRGRTRPGRSAAADGEPALGDNLVDPASGPEPIDDDEDTPASVG